MIKSGCEHVVHKLNEKYTEGCAILAIDLRNAFNSPARDEIARAVFGFHGLRPFQRLFNAEYSSPSELLYYGSNGNLGATLKSSAGVRQGSPLSTIMFCAFDDDDDLGLLTPKSYGPSTPQTGSPNTFCDVSGEPAVASYG